MLHKANTSALVLLTIVGLWTAPLDAYADALGRACDSWCHVDCSPYGDGHNGDRTVGAGTTLILTGDVYYENLTVAGTVQTRGHSIYVCGTLWVMSGGVITDSYTGGDGGEGGDGGAGADILLHGSPDGCKERDTTCTDGDPGDSGDSPGLACGGDGGCGGGGGGGGGGAWWDNPLGQNADADGGDGAKGGDGGRGGGCVYIYAFNYVNEGEIHADGAEGSDGADAPYGYYMCGAEYWYEGLRDLAGGGGGGGGGGQGGDGGTVSITVAQSHYSTAGNIHASGGAGGKGGDGGDPENLTGILNYGVLYGGRQLGCDGGAGCEGYGAGGDGGRGAYQSGSAYRAMPGGDGGDGADGEDGLVEFMVCCWPGDVDGDCDVDLADLSALLGAYGSDCEDQNYNPCADFDCDCDVDLSDQAALLGNYNCEPDYVVD